jgi:glycosyltransferase involved in cell wall biosynthesis
MRIAIVYDCLYPYTVGGAERWYRSLADRLQVSHDVTYLTRRQWDDGERPGTAFETVVVAPGGPLYTASGRRRIWPPLRFGLGVFWHMLRKGGRYDVVHSASFPYFSVIGASLALRLRRRGRLVVDWFEVWSRQYWINYLGPIGGRIGHAIQRLCIRLPERSFTFSRLHEQRLQSEGHRAPITRLTGIYQDTSSPLDGGVHATSEGLPVIVFAGRHIPEKRVVLVPEVIACARAILPAIRCVVFGDGPERPKVEARVEELGLGEAIELRGAVPGNDVRAAIARAACLLLPSAREGYGLVVVEAVAEGTPAIVVEGSENAATELVEQGVNGYVVASPEPEAIAERLVDAVRRGEELRRSTLAWYREHAEELSIDASIAAVESAYAGG